jgi:hypothetical protein
MQYQVQQHQVHHQVPHQVPQQVSQAPHPSYVVHQPIVRIDPKKDIEISKVSRVSINSQNSNNSQNRVFTPKVILSRIEA